jgi:hypothetical protein
MASPYSVSGSQSGSGSNPALPPLTFRFRCRYRSRYRHVRRGWLGGFPVSRGRVGTGRDDADGFPPRYRDRNRDRDRTRFFLPDFSIPMPIPIPIPTRAVRAAGRGSSSVGAVSGWVGMMLMAFPLGIGIEPGSSSPDFSMPMPIPTRSARAAGGLLVSPSRVG